MKIENLLVYYLGKLLGLKDIYKLGKFFQIENSSTKFLVLEFVKYFFNGG